MISSVSDPNLSTIRLAITGPTPFINPEPKYLRRPIIVEGRTVSYCSILNWRPYLGLLTHTPFNSKLSPGLIEAKFPTTVMSSPGEEVELRRAIT